MPGNVACIGCGGHVPDIDGPMHRYMLASPGCWVAYTDSLVGRFGGPIPAAFGSLTVDAYAVQHPGTPNPQATQSVWVHLIALHLVLEGGWPSSQLVRLRRLGADASHGWPWLEPPPSLGAVTAIDLATAMAETGGAVAQRWVGGAWAAWRPHADAVRATATDLVQRLNT